MSSLQYNTDRRTQFQRWIDWLDLRPIDAHWTMNTLQTIPDNVYARAMLFAGAGERLERQIGPQAKQRYQDYVAFLGGMPSLFSDYPLTKTVLLNVMQAQLYAPNLPVPQGIEDTIKRWVQDFDGNPLIQILRRSIDGTGVGLYELVAQQARSLSNWVAFGTMYADQIAPTHVRITFQDFYPDFHRHAVPVMIRFLALQLFDVTDFDHDVNEYGEIVMDLRW